MSRDAATHWREIAASIAAARARAEEERRVPFAIERTRVVLQQARQKRRERIAGLGEAQNWRCAYCYVRMRPPWDPVSLVDDDLLTEDHVVPRGAGARLKYLGNIVAACLWCNGKKADRVADEFLRSQALASRRRLVAPVNRSFAYRPGGTRP